MKKYKSQGKAVEVTVNSKEENSEDFCLDFVQEFGLCMLTTCTRQFAKFEKYQMMAVRNFSKLFDVFVLLYIKFYKECAKLLQLLKVYKN